MSSGCLKDVEIIHTNGNTIAMPRTVRTAYSAMVCNMRGLPAAERTSTRSRTAVPSRSAAGALVVIPPREQAQLHQGDRQNQHEQHDRHGGRVTHLIGASERFLVDV